MWGWSTLRLWAAAAVGTPMYSATQLRPSNRRMLRLTPFMYVISPDYLAAAGTTLLEGRALGLAGRQRRAARSGRESRVRGEGSGLAGECRREILQNVRRDAGAGGRRRRKREVPEPDRRSRSRPSSSPWSNKIRSASSGCWCAPPRSAAARSGRGEANCTGWMHGCRWTS